MRDADAGEHFVVPGIAARDRTIGDHRHAVTAARREHFGLIEIGMTFDLVADQRLRREPVRLLDHGHSEIRNADMPRQPVTLDLAQPAERLRERDLRIGPVQQQQVDLALAQPHQRVANGTLQRPRGEMRRPDFGGQENVVALDARGIEPLADLALVVIDFGGIDVAIAEPQGLFDDARTGAAAQFPRTEPDQGDFGALGLDAGYVIDGIHGWNLRLDSKLIKVKAWLRKGKAALRQSHQDSSRKLIASFHCHPRI